MAGLQRSGEAQEQVMAKDAKEKKYVVTKVTVRREASVSTYLKNGGAPDDLKQLLKGVADMGNWSMTIDKGKQIVTEAHPTVDKHPGHVDGKDWKMNIEKGNGSVDRLFLSKRKYEAEASKRDPNVTHVEIYCAAFVETDTH
jgi:hypothetical protein